LILNAHKLITIDQNNCVRYVNKTCTFDINTMTMFITEFVTRLPRRVSPVEQEPLTLLEHLNSPRVFSGVRVTWSYFICMLCRSLFVHFILVIVLSGPFRYTDSDYPFGIFKLFLRGLQLFMLSNYRFPRINDVRFVFTPICVVGGSCFMLFVFMYVHCM
jgi:hypothetical protein